MKNIEKIMSNINVHWLSFVFPKETPLEKHLADIMDSNVDEKYYIPEHFYDGYESNGKDETMLVDKILRVGTLTTRDGYDLVKRVYGVGGCSPCLPAAGGNNTIPKVIVDESHC